MSKELGGYAPLSHEDLHQDLNHNSNEPYSNGSHSNDPFENYASSNVARENVARENVPRENLPRGYFNYENFGNTLVCPSVFGNEELTIDPETLRPHDHNSEIAILPDQSNAILGRQLIHLARSDNNIEQIRDLINRGADVNCADFFEKTPLATAVENNQLEVVMALLNVHGIKYDHLDYYKQTPLALAALCGHESIFKALLSLPDVNVNSVDRYSHTVLMNACTSGKPEIVRALAEDPRLKINAIDKFNSTALIKACEAGKIDIANILFENGACLFQKNFRGENAYSILIKQEQQDLANQMRSQAISREIQGVHDFVKHCFTTNHFEGLRSAITHKVPDNPVFLKNPDINPGTNHGINSHNHSEKPYLVFSDDDIEEIKRKGIGTLPHTEERLNKFLTITCLDLNRGSLRQAIDEALVEARVALRSGSAAHSMADVVQDAMIHAGGHGAARSTSHSASHNSGHSAAYSSVNHSVHNRVNHDGYRGADRTMHTGAHRSDHYDNQAVMEYEPDRTERVLLKVTISGCLPSSWFSGGL